VHTDAPQLNDTRGFTGAATVEPGQVNYYEKLHDADAENDAAYEAMYRPKKGDYGRYFVWVSTCSMCHLKTTNPFASVTEAIGSRIRSEGCVRAGDQPACHIITMDGTHENAPACEACHGKDDPNIPKCETCHQQPLAWVNSTTPTVASIEPAGTDVTTLVEENDDNSANLNPGDEDDAKYFYLRFGPRFRQKATLGVAFQIRIAGDSSGGNASAYYNDSNGTHRLFGYTGTYGGTPVWINMSNSVSFSDLGKDEDGNFLIKVNVTGTIQNNRVIGIDYAEMNVRAQDRIYINDSHEGLECLNCHGHAHNATKDIYCASCKGDLLVSTSVHKHNFSATEKVEGVNTSNWCMECHGWQHDQAPAESRADNGSATQGYIVRVPKCFNCHNNNVTNKSWRRYSEMEIPPWGLRVHGEAAAENQRVNTTSYGEDVNVNSSCRFCHNSQHNVSFANQPQSPQCQDPNCHGSNATNGYNPSSVTAGTRINWTHGENELRGTLYELTCTSCHNNRTVTTFNSTVNTTTLINASIHLTNRSMGQWNMTPFNATRLDSTIGQVSWSVCIQCHNQSNINVGDCGGCHNSTTSESAGFGYLTIHDPDMGQPGLTLDGNMDVGNPDCSQSGCHDIDDPGSGLGTINFTDLKNNVHENKKEEAHAGDATTGTQMELSHQVDK
jgi:hypothetical protein